MNWDEAYSNADFIPGGNEFPERWAAAAESFRSRLTHEERARLDIAYGQGTRQTLDLFHPETPARGVMVFVHGGYWIRFDKSFWSHFAAGALARGWSVAMPGYPLCPEVTVPEITGSVASAISRIGDLCDGPIRLTGHSAGGHLVARMPAYGLPEAVQARIERIVPISPVSDLAPLLNTSMVSDLRLTPEVARSESPRFAPAPPQPVKVWVGAEERPVFLDQARWLADAWSVPLHLEPGRHHFDVIDGLEQPDSLLMRDILD